VFSWVDFVSILAPGGGTTETLPERFADFMDTLFSDGAFEENAAINTQY
jgi:hypothetical protein